jgi:tight adherence protein C
MPVRAGRAVTARIEGAGMLTGSTRALMAPYLAITGQSPERLVAQMLVLGGAGLLAPPVLWAVSQLAGVPTPLGVPILIALVGVTGGLAFPVIQMVSEARRRRRHFRVVIGSFVDLVVLSLAAGVGIEGALFSASQVSTDWAARRMARALLKARESGLSPWVALGQLGEELGVPELVELSTTLQLAGTEGARIRQSLNARAVSIRRHEQADAESAANTMTERLFLPGALLLVGFLVFVGYPAFSRILGGF